MRTILVVGGAGYIGSHVVHDLIENNYRVIVYDNLSEGHPEAVCGCDFICGDINDTDTLHKTFESDEIDAVMHFSACAYVGESGENPEKYYKNNVSATINLLSVMLRNNVKTFIFSSTCATYGNPVYLPIDEHHPQNPISPYGASKVMVERVLSDYANAYGLKYIALRYFNAAGAHPDGSIGESHRIETHLIPLVLKTLTKEKDSIHIFGTDYDTPDGTCIRDYIHVCDLATAHRAALEIILSGGDNNCINLGTEIGVSVKEIISICEKITEMKVPVAISDRREGDPAVLIASNSYAKKILNFSPKYDIEDIIRTAWEWERNRKF
ncbi:MAG: UDP-glucose 4-epimerase GalE [Firmicutes bacterium]|nr:UDP-glucose 4-epimerase GalE [Bacillota bacterium]